MKRLVLIVAAVAALGVFGADTKVDLSKTQGGETDLAVQTPGGSEFHLKETTDDDETTYTVSGQDANGNNVEASYNKDEKEFGVKVGHEASATYGDKDNPGGHAEGKAGYNAGVTVKDGEVEGGFEASSQVSAGYNTDKYGNEYANISGGVEGELKAEVKAKIFAALVNNKEKIGAMVGAYASAEASATGKISGTVEIYGVPISIEASGAATAGAEAGVGAGFWYDKETGMVTVMLGAAAAAGVGLKGDVKVSLGVAQLAKLLYNMALETGEFLEDLYGDVKDGATNLMNDLKKLFSGKGDSAADEMFQDGPSDRDGKGRGAERFTGLKDIKVYK